jgi:cell division protein FtsZ
METKNNSENLVKIKVLGVGGGGTNAVSRMMADKVENIDPYLINTEMSILNRNKMSNTRINPRRILQIGKQTTKGLGAGANEVMGERAALESKEEIKELLQDADMLFVTAGMGGGTGTGAAPVVAKIAKEMGILTVGIVTEPFLFEGKMRAVRADNGINKLKENVNALIVILNDKLLKVADNKTTINQAFALADNVLKQGVKSITDLVTTVGEINIDFADIKTIFDYKGKAYMGIGSAKGEETLNDAVRQAIDNPLTETTIEHAKGVIFNVTGGEDLSLTEISGAIQIINDKIDGEANIMFGTVIDKNLKDEVKVTVIATGIE